MEILTLRTGTSAHEEDFDGSVSSSITEDYFQQEETDDYFPSF